MKTLITSSILSVFLISASYADNTFTTAVRLVSPNVNYTGGGIFPAGDIDFVYVDLPSSGTLTVETVGSMDSYGIIYNGSRIEIGRDDDSGSGVNYRIVRNVAAGRYFIRTSHYSSRGTGYYDLQVRFTPSSFSATDDHGNTAATATPAGLPYMGSGVINYAGDQEWFTFSVASAGEVVINSTGATDTYGHLINAAGTRQLAADDDSGTDYNFRIRRNIPAGRYYVRVRHYSSWGTGAYGLQISFTPYSATSASADGNSSPSTAERLTSPAQIARAINFAGDNDFYRVDLTQAGVLNANTTGTTDTYGMLLNARGQQIAYSDDSAGTLNFNIRQAIPAGIYYIRVRHYSPTGSGAYSLQVNFTPGAVTTGPAVGVGTRRAVVVGVSDYLYINDLRVCDDDARAMQNVLRRKGWSVTILTDSQATKAGILNAIRNNVAGADEFLFAFSGHGTRYGSTGYLCNYDGRNASTFLSEQDLASALGSGGANVRVGVFLDSCHSGQFIDRSGTVSNRFAHPEDSQESPTVRNGAAATYLNRSLQRNGWTVLTGCRASQYSYELYSFPDLDGNGQTGHGWLSYQTITRLPQRVTDRNRNGYSAIEELFTFISGGYNGIQHPQLYDGDTARQFDVVTTD